MQHNFFKSQVYAFVTVLLWSSAFVFTKVALQYYSVASLAVLRCAIAALCLGGVLVIQKKPFPGLASLPQFFISGAAGFAIYMLIFNKGLETLNPTTSCILIATAPIITALLAQIFFGERLGLLSWAAIGLAFCGILIMTLWDGVFFISEGIFWMLAAAVLISIYNMMQRSLTRKFDPLLVASYSFFTGALLLTPLLPGAVEQLYNAPPAQMWLAVFLGTCPSAVAYGFWTKALSLAPNTSNVSSYMFLTPFLALLLEYMVTGDVPGMGTFVGGGVIMASLLIFLWASRKN